MPIPARPATLRAVARLLIVGGEARALGLARAVGREGHATRIVTRERARRAEIQDVGAECWIGDPDRLATLRGALEGVAIACWLLGSVAGSHEDVRALHGPRLASFLGQAIDSTMRGFLYQAAGSAPAAVLAEGARVAGELCARNAIPLRVLRTDPEQAAAWEREALAAVRGLLGVEAASG